MIRRRPDYSDESEHPTQKLVVKKEEFIESTSSNSNSVEEDEARIVRDFYQLCAKKHYERLLRLPQFPEHSAYPHNPHTMFPQHTIPQPSFSDPFSSLLQFKPIMPSPSYHDFHYYEAMKEMSTNQQLKLSPLSYENYISPPRPESTECTESHESEPKKSIQSKYKNCYGLVTGRVIKSIKEYLRLVRKQGSEVKFEKNSRLYYIHIKIGQMEDFGKFEDFLQEYHKRSYKEKRNRGKSTVYNYLSGDKANGLILADLIQSFLENQNPDFQSYTSKGKKHIAEVLRDERNQSYLKMAFGEMQMELERL